MLLFTWNGLWNKTGDLFEWTFRLMEVPNRNLNILFIIVGAIGAIYWIRWQSKYNKQAEEQGTIK